MTGVLAIVFLSLLLAQFVASVAVGGHENHPPIVIVGLLREMVGIALCVSVLG